MDCSEVEPLLDAYVGGELELTRQLDLEAHVATCPVCKTAAEEALDFRNSLRMNTRLTKRLAG
jgi:anti-sigma factor RsiW